MSQVLSYTQDTVAVFQGFKQVFAAARPMLAGVKEESKLMEHPLGSGAVVTDHKVNQPVEIELAVAVQGANYRDTYAEIKKLYTEGTLLTVQTRADTYERQVIAALPHEETPDNFDILEISIKLKEVRIVTAEYQALPPGKTKNPSQASTRQGGERQGEESDQDSWIFNKTQKKKGA